ncbi:glycosyltransferase [Aequorivita sp. CIP111184]|uniref:glycosyltransferase n=1 Tax=Aequorivita sp. CIP111184 TaxID=2211356 RepID=UPI000DBC3C0E|nr:glycosyltransferase [Aequorivita sp. CIP111184]SRX55335.1 GDP-mannose-dependent alpha-(1-6)-phosphatidylinositol monomannoside mannosyltransferase [Aequorivita sp. CIP111184]
MTKKSIAFVVKYFPTVSETFIVNQINGVIDAGYQVSLFAYNRVDNKVIHESLKRHDLLNRVRYFKKAPVSKLKRFFVFMKWTVKHFLKIHWPTFFRSINVFKYGKEAYTLKLFFEAQWFLLHYDFDLIHAHFGMNGERIAYLKAYGIIPKSVKIITTFHGYDLEPKNVEQYKITYANLFKYADAFTVNTPYLEGLLQQVNFCNIPHYVLPVGLDTQFFKRKNAKLKTSFFDLVFCGKLIPLKGADLAIKMVGELQDMGYKSVRLHIIGDGILREHLKRQVQMCQLEDYVLFYGALTQENIKGRLEQADVFIMPGRVDKENGRAETQGLVLQEAQAMELPVVVSDVGGIKYGLLLNESGFVVKENDIIGFVKAIEQLILNPARKKYMGKMGRDFVVKYYENRVLLEKLLSIYTNSINVKND